MNKDNKKFIVETLFLRETLKHDLSFKEFIILMYFDNDYEFIFDVKRISKATCLSETDVLTSFESLLSKGLLTLSSVKNENGKIIDKVSLENLYKGIKTTVNTENEEKEKNDFFGVFQQEYGRNLSGMDYEIINAWLSSGFSEELIIGALREAVYNGVTSLRYIDKILFEWKKKGLKKMEDVSNHLKNKDDEPEREIEFETKVLEYNWLDEK